MENQKSHLISRLDSLITELKMISDNIQALEMAHSDGKYDVGKDAFWLPAKELFDTTVKLRQCVDILLKENKKNG